MVRPLHLTRTGISWSVQAAASDAVALTATQLTGVPAALQSTQDDDGSGNGYTYAELIPITGMETMYYDSTGAILGFSSSNSY